MTSRERVRAVLEHKLPDRIPNVLGGCETEGLHVVAYQSSIYFLKEKSNFSIYFLKND